MKNISNIFLCLERLRIVDNRVDDDRIFSVFSSVNFRFQIVSNRFQNSPIYKCSSVLSSAHIMDLWQLKWDSDTEGRWTARLVRKLGPWMESNYGEVNFFRTEFLPGHGCSALDGKDVIPSLQREIVYPFFEYLRFDSDRLNLSTRIGIFSPDSIVGSTLQSEDNWETISECT